MDIKSLLVKNIRIEVVSEQELYALLKKSDGVNADYALPCFKFAKVLGLPPQKIAERLAEETSKDGIVSRAVAVNGYLNLFLDRIRVEKEVLSAVIGGQLFDDKVGEGKTVCIDYSSINIAKPFHIGHLGTTAIGSALYKTYKALGYHVVGINHLGDWGTQFGKLIVAYKLWGDKEKIDKGGVRALQEIYVRFHQEEENNPDLTRQAREWFAKIEKGDETAMQLFEYFKAITLNEVKGVYKRLHVEFDSWNGESFYNDKMQPILDLLDEKGLTEISDGAKIVNLEKYNMPPCLLVKADGATLYATRDLAAAKYRHDTYNFDKCLYVVAYQQNLHFKQFFKVLELAGFDWADKLEHVAYGMVSLADGSMSTRKGNAVWLSDVMDKAVAKAGEIIAAKNPDLVDKAEVAEQVGVGAVIFSALANSRIKDIVFDYDRVLNFDGETAPYLQYTHARCCSIVSKAGALDFDKCDFSGLAGEESWEAVKLLNEFGDILLAVTEKNEPSLLSNYLLDLAKAFNRFYLVNRVIDEGKVCQARLAVVNGIKSVLQKGLELLGIAAPEKM